MMFIYYDIENNQFTTREYHPMKGKIIVGKIASKKFFQQYADYLFQQNAVRTTVEVLSEKMKSETDEEKKKAYSEEFDKIINQNRNVQVPINRKMTQVRMRVIGHTESNNTIVEPADQRQYNLLKKNGYFTENTVNIEAD